MRISDWSSDVCSSDLQTIMASLHSAVGELAEQGAPLAHYTLGDVHLRREMRVVRHQLDAVRRFGDIQRVAFADAQACEQFLGHPHAGRIADGADFAFHEGTPEFLPLL